MMFVRLHLSYHRRSIVFSHSDDSGDDRDDENEVS